MKDDSEKRMETENDIYIYIYIYMYIYIYIYTEWKNTKLRRKGLFLIEV